MRLRCVVWRSVPGIRQAGDKVVGQLAVALGIELGIEDRPGGTDGHISHLVPQFGQGFAFLRRDFVPCPVNCAFGFLFGVGHDLQANLLGRFPRLADDLPLFRSAPATPKPGRTSALDDAFADISPDELTPREALELLYRLKALALE